MDADQFVSTVRDDAETALSRLGSSKSLYAATGGEMDADEVYRAAADAEHAARRTFETWADAEDGDVGALFDGVADTERDHYETVTADLDDHDPGAVPAVHEFLREREATLARLGGFVGRTLASEQSKGQMVGFFTGQADPQTAQLFRDLKGDLDEQRERALAVLADRCESDEDWERARDAATGAIEAAYDEYTRSLESMGVNPKPVC